MPDKRVAIIEAITTPLGLFVFVLSIVELTLLANLAVVPDTMQPVIVYSSIAILALVILLVAGIAIWRPEALYGRSRITETFARSVGNDICAGFEMYVSNLPSKEERLEAYETLIALIEQEGDSVHSRTRSALAEAIRTRSSIIIRRSPE